MPKIDYGKVWSALRSSLSIRRERFIAAFEAESYERESAKLDALAREMADEVQQVIEAEGSERP